MAAGDIQPTSTLAVRAIRGQNPHERLGEREAVWTVIPVPPVMRLPDIENAVGSKRP